MLSPEAFAVGHLAIAVAGLIAFALWDRRSRDVHHHWHRNVRCRHISTNEVMRMIEKATSKGRDAYSPPPCGEG